MREIFYPASVAVIGVSAKPDNLGRNIVANLVTYGFDGIVCGHIHQPHMRRVDGLLYCNDGDWVENCTALVETPEGQLELLHWPRLREQLPFVEAANDYSALPVVPAARAR